MTKYILDAQGVKKGKVKQQKNYSFFYLPRSISSLYGVSDP